MVQPGPASPCPHLGLHAARHRQAGARQRPLGLDGLGGEQVTLDCKASREGAGVGWREVVGGSSTSPPGLEGRAPASFGQVLERQAGRSSSQASPAAAGAWCIVCPSSPAALPRTCSVRVCSSTLTTAPSDGIQRGVAAEGQHGSAGRWQLRVMLPSRQVRVALPSPLLACPFPPSHARAGLTKHAAGCAQGALGCMAGKQAQRA